MKNKLALLISPLREISVVVELLARSSWTSAALAPEGQKHKALSATATASAAILTGTRTALPNFSRLLKKSEQPVLQSTFCTLILHRGPDTVVSAGSFRSHQIFSAA